MFDKEIISIDITNERISILVGTRLKLIYSTIIDTPAGAYIKDELVDIGAIKNAIENNLGKARFRTKSKDVSFVLRGDDLIVRHITLPNMKEAAIKDSVEWELTQFVGERADEYSVSYEVISAQTKQSDSNIEILMTAVEKNKVNKYVDLAKALNLDIVSIDIISNVTSRIIKAYQNVFNKSIKSIGVIDLSKNYSSLAIIERGKLQMEKYLALGLASTSLEELNDGDSYNRFIERINLDSEDDFTNGKLQNYFDNITNQFNGIIQFYSSGKVKKTLDKIYVIGSGTKIPGLLNLLEDVFNTRVEIVPSLDDMRFSIKTHEKLSINNYFYNYGMILNNNKNKLNLVPESYNSNENSAKKQKTTIILAIVVFLILVGGYGGVQAKRVYLQYQKKALTDEYEMSKALIQKSDKLDNDINLITQHITKAKELGNQKTKGTDELIKNLSSKFPNGIKVTNMNYTKDAIIIAGIADSQQQVEELWANLRESDKFAISHVSTINSDKGKITFNLEIKLKAGV